LPEFLASFKTLPAGTWEQLYECAIVELDHAQLPGRILDARHAILDRAEEILTRPSGDEHRASAGSNFAGLQSFFEGEWGRALPSAARRRL